MENLDDFLSGKRLYGDDFSQQEIEIWFQDEAEAYANLGSKNEQTYSYGYHELNKYHAFNRLTNRSFSKCLGLGSAYGEEFKPILNKIKHLTILEPSQAFSNNTMIGNTPCEYIKPSISGRMKFESLSFDLICCLGVLHHIPNVSTVLNECYRCLADKGIMILREPIVSMGDWRKHRVGLTKRERGIPLQILRKSLQSSGFIIFSESLCNFSPLARFATFFNLPKYNNRIITRIDALLCKAFSFNLKYHRSSLLDKFSPDSVFFILEKQIG